MCRRTQQTTCTSIVRLTCVSFVATISAVAEQTISTGSLWNVFNCKKDFMFTFTLTGVVAPPTVGLPEMIWQNNDVRHATSHPMPSLVSHISGHYASADEQV
jgi:hypothetical protein